jgi:hypothetical protein
MLLEGLQTVKLTNGITRPLLHTTLTGTEHYSSMNPLNKQAKDDKSKSSILFAMWEGKGNSKR